MNEVVKYFRDTPAPDSGKIRKRLLQNVMAMSDSIQLRQIADQIKTGVPLLECKVTYLNPLGK